MLEPCLLQPCFHVAVLFLLLVVLAYYHYYHHIHHYYHLYYYQYDYHMPRDTRPIGGDLRLQALWIGHIMYHSIMYIHIYI